MAIYTFQNAALKISYETGVDEFGKSIVSSKTYNNVRDNIQPDQLLAVVQGIGSLSNYPIIEAIKTEAETLDM